MRETVWKYPSVRGVVNTMAPRVVAKLAETNRPAARASRGQKPPVSPGKRARSRSSTTPVNRQMPATAAKDSWRDTLAAA